MYYALALFAIALTAVLPRHRLPLRIPAALARALAHRAVVPLAVVALVVAQHAYLRLLLAATYDQRPLLPLLERMPVRFIDSLAPNHLSAGYGDGFAALALIESLALCALYCGLALPQRWQLGVVACGFVVTCADAVTARAATSADMYSYVGFTLLGIRAYAPPAEAFAGAYAVINGWWHTPLVAAPYGPLWLAVASVAAAAGHTLLAKIVALRLLGALTLAGTAAVLLALKIPVRVVALVALNPALVFAFVANVHNDLFGVLLLLLARYAMVRGTMWFAILAAAAAGLVKLPFALFAALTWAPLRSPRRRVSAYGAALVLSLGASWIWGGGPYVEALRRHAAERPAGEIPLAVVGAVAVLKAVALAAVTLAFASGGFVEGCAWAMPALGALLHPWYLSWALPYAVAAHETLRNVALALPVAMLATDASLAHGTLLTLAESAAYVWLGIALVRALVARLRTRAAA